MFDAFDSRAAVPFEDAAPRTVERAGARLRCAACGHVLGRSTDACAVSGRLRHRATNPAGFTYSFRTYTCAAGCAVDGTPVGAHSWFPPLAWQLACCGACGVHCGWCFSQAGSRRFFALIESRLVEDRER